MSGQEKLFANTVVVPSFTEPGVEYTINLDDKTCSCPAFKKAPKQPCKHLMSVPNLIPKPKPITRPTYSMAMSALIKATRLRNVEDAIYWSTYLSTFPDERFRLIRRLFVMAGEDCVSIPVQIRAGQHFGNYAKATLLTMAAEVVRICKTPNWYAFSEGRTWIWLKCKAEEIKDPKLATLTFAQQKEAIGELLSNATGPYDHVSHARAIRVMDLFDVKRGYKPKEMYQWFYEAAKDMDSPEAATQAALCVEHYNAVTRDINYDMQILSRLFWSTFGENESPKVIRGEVMDLLDLAKKRWEKPLPIPDHYLDGIHTVGSDRRFAGTVRSCLGQCHAYIKYGRVHPDDPWDKSFWVTPEKPLDFQ